MKQLKVVGGVAQHIKPHISMSSYSSDLQLFSTDKTPRFKHYDIRYHHCNYEQYDDFLFAIERGELEEAKAIFNQEKFRLRAKVRENGDTIFHVAA